MQTGKLDCLWNVKISQKNHLIVEQACAGKVVPVFANFQPGIWKDLVVVGPGGSRQVDDLVRIVRRQKLSANLCNAQSVSNPPGRPTDL